MRCSPTASATCARARGLATHLSARAAGRDADARRALPLLAGRIALRISGRTGAAGETPALAPAQADERGRRLALPERIRPGPRDARQDASAPDDRARAGADRRARLRALLPHRARHRRVRARAGILCQGRGSAANSAVCYALGITEVDPARMSMLFERFISKERNEPPDIDVDFEHERREEVIQYIYAQVRPRPRRARRHRDLLPAQERGARRRQGAGPLRSTQVDRLAARGRWWDGPPTSASACARRASIPESADPPPAGAVARRCWISRATCRSTSVASSSPRAARTLVPVENAAMADRTVIQWDKDDLDALGLLKVDCLALGMLSCDPPRLDLGRLHARTRPCAIHAVTSPRAGPFDTVDAAERTPNRLRHDPARRHGRRVPDRVARADGDAAAPEAREFLRPRDRSRDRARRARSRAAWCIPTCGAGRASEPVTYPSEAVREVLGRTLGVPIFQEQVMQLAIVAAGFSPGRGRPPAALDGGVAAQGRPRALRGAPGRRHGASAATPASSPPDLPADPGLR